MPKGQVKALVSYCIFMLVLTQLLQHSPRFHNALEPIVALFGSILPIAISVVALKNGWAMGRVSLFDRDNSSVSFWLLVAWGFLLGAYLAYQGVTGLLVLAR